MIESMMISVVILSVMLSIEMSEMKEMKLLWLVCLFVCVYC